MKLKSIIIGCIVFTALVLTPNKAEAYFPGGFGSFIDCYHNDLDASTGMVISRSYLGTANLAYETCSQKFAGTNEFENTHLTGIAKRKNGSIFVAPGFTTHPVGQLPDDIHCQIDHGNYDINGNNP